MIDIDELLRKYLDFWQVYKYGWKNRTSMKRVFAKSLKDAKIPWKVVSSYSESSLNADECFNIMIQSVNNPELFINNKDLCKRYIEFCKINHKTRMELRSAKFALEKKISSIDPMLLKYFKYRISLFDEQKKLESFLVKETPESLKERYGELMEKIGL